MQTINPFMKEMIAGVVNCDKYNATDMAGITVVAASLPDFDEAVDIK